MVLQSSQCRSYVLFQKVETNFPVIKFIHNNLITCLLSIFFKYFFLPDRFLLVIMSTVWPIQLQKTKVSVYKSSILSLCTNKHHKCYRKTVKSSNEYFLQNRELSHNFHKEKWKGCYQFKKAPVHFCKPDPACDIPGPPPKQSAGEHPPTLVWCQHSWDTLLWVPVGEPFFPCSSARAGVWAHRQDNSSWRGLDLLFVYKIWNKIMLKQIKELALGVSRSLRSIGLQKGDVVGILLPNCLEYPLLVQVSTHHPFLWYLYT